MTTPFWDGIAAMAPNVPRLYAVNQVPQQPTYPYAVLDVIPGRGDVYTLDATHGLRWVEAVVQCYGHTSTSAGDLMERFIADVLDQRPVVVGYECGPTEMELDPTATDDRDDDGVIGLITVLRFTAIKEAVA